MGEHTPYRAKVFKTTFEEICRHFNSTADNICRSHAKSCRVYPLAPQLGISRSKLLEWTVDEYSVEANQLLEVFAKGAAKGENGLRESRKLANAVHHYAHALSSGAMTPASSSDDMSATTGTSGVVDPMELRKKVYKLLMTNIKRRRVLNQLQRERTGTIMTDWPELLKVAAEAGQHVVTVGTPKARKKVANEVMKLLEEMLATCHEDQRPAVMLMVAHMHSQLAMIALANKDTPAAIKSFAQALNITEQLTLQSGDHILVTPLTQLANARAMAGQFAEASALYRRAITIAQDHLGHEHYSLAQHLVNFGIAKVQSLEKGEGRELLNRAAHILRKYEQSLDSDSAPSRQHALLKSRISDFLKLANS